jgi:hypothetical protein
MSSHLEVGHGLGDVLLVLVLGLNGAGLLPRHLDTAHFGDIQDTLEQ